MNYVKSFEVLLVLVRQDVVDLTQPGERRVVGSGSQRMEVDDDVITFY